MMKITAFWPENPQQAELDEIAHAVGVIAMLWTEVEVQFVLITQAVLRLPISTTVAVTTHIGDRTLTDLTLAAVGLENESDLQDAVEHVVRLLHTNRENRNCLVHGSYDVWLRSDGTHDVKLLRSTARGQLKHSMRDVTLADARRVATEIAELRHYISTLAPAISDCLAGRLVSWPQKPAAPGILTNTLPPTQWPPPPPQSSEA